MNCESRRQSSHNMGCVISTNSFFIILVKFLSKGLYHLLRKLLYNVIYSGYEYEFKIQIHLPLNSTLAT